MSSGLETVRPRLDFLKSTIETVEGHIDDEADRQALIMTLGVLKQMAVDLDEYRDKNVRKGPETGRPGFWFRLTTTSLS